MKFLTNPYYSWRLSEKLNRFDVAPLINILVDENKFSTPEVTENPYKFSTEKEPLYIFNKTDGTFNVFFKNLHIHSTKNSTDKYIIMSLKKDSDMWVVEKKGDDYDFSNVANETIEVFCWYDILVMNRSHCINTEYIRGSWNQYFYETLCEIESLIKSYTQASRFTKEYNKNITPTKKRSTPSKTSSNPFFKKLFNENEGTKWTKKEVKKK